MSGEIFSYILPLAVCVVGALMLFARRDLFAEFCEGAREGIKSALSLAPALVALMVAVKMLFASGAIEAAVRALSPLASALGVPPELLPLLVTRPVSGSASFASYSELLAREGADGFVGLCASVIMGSSDTMIYVIAVYFSSVGIKKSRYAMPCAAAVMLFCILFSCFVCRLLFK